MSNRKLRVDMNAIVNAMDPFRDESGQPTERFWLDLQTGELRHIITVDEDGDDSDEFVEFENVISADPGRYAEVPDNQGDHDYDDMVRFTDTLDEADIQEQLKSALSGKGAFRRFRDVLGRHDDIREQWFLFKRRQFIDIAVAWLDELGIEADYEDPLPVPQSRREDHSSPIADILDLLLFGAPDGKTEIIQGKTWRYFEAKNKDEARRVFKKFAKEFCVLHGLEWRNKYLVDPDTFVIGRVHLHVHGKRIDLSIETSVEVWQAFQR